MAEAGYAEVQGLPSYAGGQLLRVGGAKKIKQGFEVLIVNLFTRDRAGRV
jgi:hypothetical protein